MSQDRLARVLKLGKLGGAVLLFIHALPLRLLNCADNDFPVRQPYDAELREGRAHCCCH